MAVFHDRTRAVKRLLKRLGEKPNLSNVDRAMPAAYLRDGQKQDIRDRDKRQSPEIRVGGRTVWTPGQKRPSGS